MIHVHGPHDCYCPVCGTVVTVGEGEQCSGIYCTECGERMRAIDIGEKRPATREIVGYSQADLSRALDIMESSLELGQKASISICTEALPTNEELDCMHLGMVAEGCHVSRPTTRLIKGIPTTKFVLRKGSPAWALIIPLLIPLFTIGLIAFGITKIGDISKAIMPIILVCGGLVIVIAVTMRKPVEKYIERGGKIPGLPSTTPKKLLAVR